MTPCPLRVDLLQAVIQANAGAQGSELAYGTYDLDPSRAHVYVFAAELAGPITESAIEVDPLSGVTWGPRPVPARHR